jgi:hypothetical protein
VCCSICDVGISRKWLTWKNSLSASNFALNRGEKSYENFIKLLKVAVGEQTVGRTHI